MRLLLLAELDRETKPVGEMICNRHLTGVFAEVNVLTEIPLIQTNYW